MADNVDAWLAATAPAAPAPAAHDPVDQWLAATAPAPAPVNMHPRSQSMSDVDLGIESGPIVDLPRMGPAAPTPLAGGANEQQMYAPPPRRIAPELEGDPTAQNVVSSVLAGGAGKLIGPVLGRLGPVAQRALTGATEGAISSKQTGGSAGAGALVGGALGAAGGAVEGAPARVRERALKDIVEGEGEGAKPPKPLVRKLAARAGEDGERLGQVLDEDPGLEHVLSTGAARHPKKALASIQEIIDRNDAMNQPVYQAITDAGGVKLTSVVSPMQKLKDAYIAADKPGGAQAAEAVQREIDSLVKNYGGKVPENAVLTGKQLQQIRNQIGEAAFPDRLTPKSVKNPVNRDLYGAYRGAIEDAAGTLQDIAPGVDLGRFRARNQSTSLLIPMRNVLKERVMSEETGAKSLRGRIQEALPEMMLSASMGEGMHMAGGGVKEAIAAAAIPRALRLAAQAGRHLDYGLSRLAPHVESGEGAAAELVRGQTKDQAADALTPEDVVRAGEMGAAARRVRPPAMLNGVRFFGRPATAEERAAGGLPASLHHAIETNDPNLGHAALSNEVLGQ